MANSRRSVCLYLVQHGEAVAEAIDPMRPAQRARSSDR